MNAFYFLPPFWVTTLLLTSIYTLGFRLIVGRHRGSLILYWTAGLAGFLMGQWAGDVLLPNGIVLVGDVHIVEASVSSWVLILIANRTRV